MSIAEYLKAVDDQLRELEGIISTCSIERRIDANLNIGFIKGRVEFVDGSCLEFSEQLPVQRRKFRFHYMDAEQHLIVRWDSAPHHRTVSTFPFHQHTPRGIYDYPAITLLEVLDVIAAMVARQ
ncbi:MAG TPA: DUF6516 family protein [Anaerolineae bacterium]|nr:DUF6516 family protein [Anaerolineae bacterium]HQK12923.1 DUF6516 family protein [Anaerolineae bacterium]